MSKYLNLRANIAIGLIFAFLANTFGPLPLAEAQDLLLPAPGVMVPLSPTFNPPILKGIKVNPENPFKFDFILDQGDGQLSNDALKDESRKLIKYFLASLTIPEKDLWVNLSPYEKDRIVPESFGQTKMGRDLLAEDYMLKQITASLIYPEGETGKKFWKRIYEVAAKKFGTTNVPINTFNKVWIVPEKAVVYENAKVGAAYVVESTLKVMLEEDYLSLQKHGFIHNDVASVGANIVREIVIPELTKEVNYGANFAQLRQVYNSLILATWYKKKIKDSILEQIYADKNKVVGVNINDPQEKEKIYKRYLQAFKKGVFNYIKDSETPDGVSGATLAQSVPRKYFSGGVLFKIPNSAMLVTSNAAMLSRGIVRLAKMSIVAISLFAAAQAIAVPREHILAQNMSDVETQFSDIKAPNISKSFQTTMRGFFTESHLKRGPSQQILKQGHISIEGSWDNTEKQYTFFIRSSEMKDNFIQIMTSAKGGVKELYYNDSYCALAGRLVGIKQPLIAAVLKEVHPPPYFLHQYLLRQHALDGIRRENPSLFQLSSVNIDRKPLFDLIKKLPSLDQTLDSHDQPTERSYPILLKGLLAELKLLCSYRTVTKELNRLIQTRIINQTTITQDYDSDAKFLFGATYFKGFGDIWGLSGHELMHNFQSENMLNGAFGEMFADISGFFMLESLYGKEAVEKQKKRFGYGGNLLSILPPEGDEVLPQLSSVTDFEHGLGRQQLDNLESAIGPEIDRQALLISALEIHLEMLTNKAPAEVKEEFGTNAKGDFKKLSLVKGTQYLLLKYLVNTKQIPAHDIASYMKLSLKSENYGVEGRVCTVSLLSSDALRDYIENIKLKKGDSVQLAAGDGAMRAGDVVVKTARTGRLESLLIQSTGLNLSQTIRFSSQGNSEPLIISRDPHQSILGMNYHERTLSHQEVLALVDDKGFESILGKVRFLPGWRRYKASLDRVRLQLKSSEQPFVVKEVSFLSPVITPTFLNTETVYARYFVPKGSEGKRLPAVTICSFFDQDPFARLLSIYLVSQGIVVLEVGIPLFGKRSSPGTEGKSSVKRYVDLDFNVEKFKSFIIQSIADTLVAVRWLASQREVDHRRISLTGQSMTGAVALSTYLLDSNVKNIFALVPVVNYAHLLWSKGKFEPIRRLLESKGITEEQFSTGLEGFNLNQLAAEVNPRSNDSIFLGAVKNDELVPWQDSQSLAASLNQPKNSLRAYGIPGMSAHLFGSMIVGVTLGFFQKIRDTMMKTRDGAMKVVGSQEDPRVVEAIKLMGGIIGRSILPHLSSYSESKKGYLELMRFLRGNHLDPAKSDIEVLRSYGVDLDYISYDDAENCIYLPIERNGMKEFYYKFYLNGTEEGSDHYVEIAPWEYVHIDYVPVDDFEINLKKDEPLIEIDSFRNFIKARILTNGSRHIPVCVTLDHDNVYQWILWLLKKGFVSRDVSLINIDQHDDVGYGFNKLNIGNWVGYLAQRLILAGKMIWFDPYVRGAEEGKQMEKDSFGQDHPVLQNAFESVNFFSDIVSFKTNVRGKAIVTIDFDAIANELSDRLTDERMKQRVNEIVDILTDGPIEPVAINFTYSQYFYYTFLTPRSVPKLIRYFMEAFKTKGFHFTNGLPKATSVSPAMAVGDGAMTPESEAVLRQEILYDFFRKRKTQLRLPAEVLLNQIFLRYFSRGHDIGENSDLISIWKKVEGELALGTLHPNEVFSALREEFRQKFEELKNSPEERFHLAVATTLLVQRGIIFWSKPYNKKLNSMVDALNGDGWNCRSISYLTTLIMWEFGFEGISTVDVLELYDGRVLTDSSEFAEHGANLVREGKLLATPDQGRLVRHRRVMAIDNGEWKEFLLEEIPEGVEGLTLLQMHQYLEVPRLTFELVDQYVTMDQRIEIPELQRLLDESRRLMQAPPFAQYSGGIQVREMAAIFELELSTVRAEEFFRAAVEAFRGTTYSEVLPNLKNSAEGLEDGLRSSAEIIASSEHVISTESKINEILQTKIVEAKKRLDRTKGFITEYQRILDSKPSAAMRSEMESKMLDRGGIDLTPTNKVLQTQNNGIAIKFHISPAQLAQWQRAPGVMIESISIQPLKSLSAFLGINQ